MFLLSVMKMFYNELGNLNSFTVARNQHVVFLTVMEHAEDLIIKKRKKWSETPHLESDKSVLAYALQSRVLDAILFRVL
jgi:hypothetical protein